MGIPVSVQLADDLPYATLAAHADGAFAWLRLVDELFSTYKPGSEVSRLRRGDLRLDDCSPHVRDVVERCAELWRDTDGYFDVYAAGGLDPSGYVKGWAVQVASDALVEAGAVNHCINAGGDVRVRGCPADATAWRIGVRHPWEPLAVCFVLTGTDLAVATSGTYERGAHVIDPHRGVPAQHLRSVTVVGPDLGLADAYATAAVAMGEAALEWLAGLDGYESAVVTEDRRCFRSAGLPAL
ncbi:FAD:protein FMN transferase [Planosporangium thailandense]|uniref:FAD:protein FMN transferase n=1 Tax=Planosporangium thailandense TaxID=765197 RepID=A0ABX0Y631_9ACTN|nr:FAD:protein FMN transferase [Planosporangium thailandense]NJC73798.1 FAD:protein FMN transferase [Planosporangium thailandense]